MNYHHRYNNNNNIHKYINKKLKTKYILLFFKFNAKEKNSCVHSFKLNNKTITTKLNFQKRNSKQKTINIKNT